MVHVEASLTRVADLGLIVRYEGAPAPKKKDGTPSAPPAKA